MRLNGFSECKLKNSSCLKQRIGQKSWYLVCSITLNRLLERKLKKKHPYYFVAYCKNWTGPCKLNQLNKLLIERAHFIWLVMTNTLLSSPEPKAPRQWLWRPSFVRQHFQTSSPLKPLGQLNSNFIWRLLRMGERKFLQMFLVTWPRWPPCPYMVKTL